jgi:hypothetical protein
VAFALGLFLIYVSLLFTQADDGRIQNWLVDLWIRVEEKSVEKGTRMVAFFNTVAKLISAAFDDLFGLKLFSLRFVSTSTTLSMCSLYLMSMIRFGEHSRGRVWYAGLFFASCLIADYVRKQSNGFIFVFAAALSFAGIYVWDWFWAIPGVTVIQDAPVLVGIGIGVYLDALFVAAIRKILRTQTQEQSHWKILGTAILSLAMGSILIAPSWLYLSAATPFFGLYADHPIRFSFAWTFVISSTTNLFASLCAFSLLIVSAMALGHKALWNVASKMIHVCHERRVVENRPFLFTLGALLLSYSINWFSWLRQIPH